jgi:hypothetical protein
VDFGAGIHSPAELRFYSNLEKETIDDLKQKRKSPSALLSPIFALVT